MRINLDTSINKNTRFQSIVSYNLKAKPYYINVLYCYGCVMRSNQKVNVSSGEIVEKKNNKKPKRKQKIIISIVNNNNNNNKRNRENLFQRLIQTKHL